MKVIVLPGLDGTSVLREPFARRLEAETGLSTEVLAFPPDRLCTYDEVKAHVAPLLPAVGSGPFILVGESFSGPIALRLTLERETEVAALVMVGTYVTNPWPFPGGLMRPFIRPFLFKFPPPPRLIRKFIVASTAADDLMPLFQDVVRKMVKPEVLACRLRSCTRIDARDELRQCRVPMLHVTAEHERILPRNVDDLMRRIRPDLQTVRLPCGHCILECYPDLAVPVVAEFLRRVVPAI